jgi:hypothetical protein
MADESGLSRNRRYIVWDTEKASLNKLQTTIHALVWAKNTVLARPFCLSVTFFLETRQQCKPRSLLEQCCLNVDRGHCWAHVVTMTSDHIIATMILDNTVAFDTIVAFLFPLVAMLTSAPVMWRGHLLNFSILQGVRYLSKLVYKNCQRHF